MSDWQERITRDTAPSIRAEHELRYRMAAPLIESGAPWADLGCGNGVAAAAGFGAARPARAVLVDIDAESVSRAAQELGLASSAQLAADLSDAADLARVGEAVLGLGGEPVITCFEVVEHLPAFAPLLEWATALAREHGATFLMSVPNDAFWAIQNPHHASAWGEGAFEELVGLLPAERTLRHQVALSGSVVVDPAAPAQLRGMELEVGGEGAVASHFIAAFGPRHAEVSGGAIATQTDVLAQRRWERRRESNLLLSQELAGTLRRSCDELEARNEKQREELRERTVWFDEWRVYIHELERELGRPVSGAAEEEHPPDAQPPPAPAGEPAPLAGAEPERTE